jgi:NAD-dependent dihydropyrimidine dehydrogenase PreA subunit
MKYLSGVSTLALFPDKCTGCGTCVEVCPHRVLAISGKKAFIVDRDICMECGACMTNCGFGALQVNKGVGCAAAIINSMISGGEPSCDCSGDTKKTDCC